jgi:carboxyl-terminal processing protease
LISAFKTKNGRTVFEGRGISPDVRTKPFAYSNIALTLFSKYLIFDYATKFRRENPTIAPADQFELTDANFDDFMKFISDKNYEYTTRTEKALEELKKNAEKEHYFNAIKTEYDALKTQMANDKKGDLIKHKEQIKELLKLEILTRYYFQKGRIIASLKSDTDIQEGVKIINDGGLYQSILAGTYKQPVVEPEDDFSNITADPDGEDNQ